MILYNLTQSKYFWKPISGIYNWDINKILISYIQFFNFVNSRKTEAVWKTLDSVFILQSTET